MTDRRILLGLALIGLAAMAIAAYGFLSDLAHDREVLAAAQAATDGRLGDAWEEFEAHHGSMADGRFSSIDCKRTERGDYVLVEDGAVKMVAIDFHYGGIIEDGTSREHALDLARQYLPTDAVHVEDRTLHSRRDPRYETLLSVYRVESLTALFPETHWGGGEPGIVTITMSRLGPESLNPDYIGAVFLQFRLTDGRHPSRTGRLRSSGTYLQQPDLFRWPWEMHEGESDG